MLGWVLGAALAVSGAQQTWIIVRNSVKDFSAVAVQPTKPGQNLIKSRHLYISPDNGAGVPILVLTDSEFDCSKRLMRATGGLTADPERAGRMFRYPRMPWGSIEGIKNLVEYWEVPCKTDGWEPNKYVESKSDIASLIRSYFEKTIGRGNPLPPIPEH